jgi:hypothetical protein
MVGNWGVIVVDVGTTGPNGSVCAAAARWAKNVGSMDPTGGNCGGRDCGGRDCGGRDCGGGKD